jgi:hypothetical protein
MKARDAIHEHIGYESGGLVGDDTVPRLAPLRRRGVRAADVMVVTVLLAIACAGLLMVGTDPAADAHLQVAVAELQAAEQRGEQRALRQVSETVHAAYKLGLRDGEAQAGCLRRALSGAGR